MQTDIRVRIQFSAANYILRVPLATKFGRSNVLLPHNEFNVDRWRGNGIAEGCAVVHVNTRTPIKAADTTQDHARCADRPSECGVSLEDYQGWCRSCVAVRATPARDYKCHKAPHDFTDDVHLLPPDVKEMISK